MEKNSAPKFPARALVETDVAVVVGIGTANIEVSVQETLRCVRMGVDDNCGIMDSESFRADAGRGLRRKSCRKHTKQENRKRKPLLHRLMRERAWPGASHAL
jgi:hypothetical protein